jgi:hypothetical protein
MGASLTNPVNPMNTLTRSPMRRRHFFTAATLVAASLLTACGGGGGVAGPAPAPEPVKTLSSLAVKDIPAKWPENFKTVSVSKTDLVTDGELAQTSNKPNAVFIQIWYLDQDQQRQPVAVLTMDALTRSGGSLTIRNVPASVRFLKSEVYTLNVDMEKTLASKEIPV